MAKTATYTLIASTTITTSTPTVSFTSIPATYTDLILVVGGLLQVNSGNGLRMRFNNDSGTNYSVTQVRGNGSVASSAREANATSGYAGGATYSDTGIGDAICHIFDYANTTTFKTNINRGNQSGADTVAQVGLWRSTAAINRIDLAMGASFPSNNISTGTFKLYGIEAGNL